MRNSIIYTEKDGYRIIGNVNFCFPNLAEVRLISPFNGFILRGERSVVNTNTGRTNEDYLKELLERAFEVSKKLQQKNQVITSEFLKLQETLLKFNNNKTEDFQRNRSELMKVLINSNFPELEYEINHIPNLRNDIYHFLSRYFAEFGTYEEPDFRTKFTEIADPPKFENLFDLLNQYRNKNEQEKIEMIAIQVITGKTGTFDWFLQQEFFRTKI